MVQSSRNPARQLLSRMLCQLCVLLVLGLGSLTDAYAGNAVEVQVGSENLRLPQSAPTQDKHYLDEEQALLDRIGALLKDADYLLRRLHALPPELAEMPAMENPATAELATLIQLALANSPDLAPYRSEMAAEAARTKQEGAQQDPMLMFNVMHSVPRTGWLSGSVMAEPMPEDAMPTDDGMPMTQFMLGVKQMYMSYGKRSVMRSIAHMEERLTELELADQELKLVEKVTDLYFRLASTKAQLSVMNRNIELMRLLVELGEKKYALGLTPQALVISGQVQLTGMQREQLDMQQMLDEDLAMLTGLLGFPSGFNASQLMFSLNYPQPVAPDWTAADLLPRALELRPDYLKQEAVHEQQGLRLELAHREYRPDYTLSLEYNLDTDKRDTLKAGIELPLFTHKSERQDAMVQEMYSMQAMSNDDMAMIQNMLNTDLESLRVRLKNLTGQIELYRQGLVPQARLALDSNLAGYAANMMDFSDLLMAQQAQQTIELELEQKYIDYVATLTKLQLVTAGAFNPAPYLGLAQQPAEGDAVAQPLDIQAIIEQLEAPVEPPTVEEMLNDLGQGEPEPGPPEIGPTFLESVGISPAPEVDPAPEPGPTTETSSQDSAPETEQSAPQGSQAETEQNESEEQTGFYAPFEPKQDGQHEG